MPDFPILRNFGGLAKRLRAGSGIEMTTPDHGVIEIASSGGGIELPSTRMMLASENNLTTPGDDTGEIIFDALYDGVNGDSIEAIPDGMGLELAETLGETVELRATEAGLWYFSVRFNITRDDTAQVMVFLGQTSGDEHAAAALLPDVSTATWEGFGNNYQTPVAHLEHLSQAPAEAIWSVTWQSFGATALNYNPNYYVEWFAMRIA